MLSKQYKEYTGEVEDSMGLRFSVTIGYYPAPPSNLPSIESYELEGDNVSRDELVERFGKNQVNNLEEELN